MIVLIVLRGFRVQSSVALEIVRVMTLVDFEMMFRLDQFDTRLKLLVSTHFLLISPGSAQLSSYHDDPRFDVDVSFTCIILSIVKSFTFFLFSLHRASRYGPSVTFITYLLTPTALYTHLRNYLSREENDRLRHSQRYPNHHTTGEIHLCILPF